MNTKVKRSGLKGLLVAAPVLILGLVGLGGCATDAPAKPGEAPSLSAKDDCYVTGSRIAVNRKECADARREKGVAVVDPEGVKTRSGPMPVSK